MRSGSTTSLAALYYALLLKDAGCSSNASRMAALFGTDDQQVKPRMKVVDWDDRIQLAVETWRNTGLSRAVVAHAVLPRHRTRQENMTRDIIAARCERGADIARRLGFPALAATASTRSTSTGTWQGYPDGTRGNEIPLLSRILNIAQTAEVFLATGGIDAVMTVLHERSSRWFDPDLVDRVLDWRHDVSWWESMATPDVEREVLALEPSRGVRVLDDSRLEQVAMAFAEVIAKSPYVQALVQRGPLRVDAPLASVWDSRPRR
ncbi:MAG: hypothetical protein U0163_04140 [Gemmatimonadaceae bacterium]